MNGTLLIVEDQSYFRKGIRKMIEDHPIGWTVVGEAENGKEALELIHHRRPDLILTDIRMPAMDGIELAEYIHRNKLGIDLIILTGYEDFSYAQAALRYGAIDFLLKPCDEETLIQVLQKAYGHVSGKRKELQRMKAAEKANEEALLRAFMLRLPQQAADLGMLTDRLLHRHLMLVIVNSFFPAGKRYEPQDIGLLQFAMFNIISELMVQGGFSFQSIPLEYDQFALIIEEGEASVLAASVEQQIRSCLGIQVTAATFGPIRKTDDVREAYERIRGNAPYGPAAAAYRFGAGTMPPGLSREGIPSKVKELQTQLTSDIALGRPDQLSRTLGAAIERIAALPLEDAKLETAALVLALNGAAKQSLEMREEAAAASLSAVFERLQSVKTTAEATDMASQCSAAFAAEYDRWRASKNHNIVGKLLDYLDRHYMESCTLTETAARFHISTAYLSKLFKKETGDNFSSYVTKLRMRKAAALLLNTDMKVFEIAQAIGYDDPNYFTNVFRMIHQLSPSEYRKQHKP
ncbi:response regulator [Paenibacillus chartarius]|uniref:Response regulator n=1 Tax=Paenibacillus chartarius TaxID=747481 RepID=A0ABV6DH99_9BACL